MSRRKIKHFTGTEKGFVVSLCPEQTEIYPSAPQAMAKALELVMQMNQCVITMGTTRYPMLELSAEDKRLNLKMLMNQSQLESVEDMEAWQQIYDMCRLVQQSGHSSFPLTLN